MSYIDHILVWSTARQSWCLIERERDRPWIRHGKKATRPMPLDQAFTAHVLPKTWQVIA